jgi:hypothetical protein
MNLGVMRLDCCYGWATTDPVCATWSISGTSAATITPLAQPGTARLRLDGVPRGTRFEVTATIGSTTLRTTISVPQPPDDPRLVGHWHEIRRVDCDGSPITGFDTIGDLQLDADGALQATWQPFERYVDYWGQFQADQETGAFTFEISGGNVVPTDPDRSGTYTIESGELHFRDLYFGTHDGPPTPACEHVFAR